MPRKPGSVPNPSAVRSYARKHELWSMHSGKGDDFHYDFWDAKTGALILTWYVQSRHWVAPGKANMDGQGDYRDAISAVRDVSST